MLAGRRVPMLCSIAVPFFAKGMLTLLFAGSKGYRDKRNNTDKQYQFLFHNKSSKLFA
jgi:hypothetical protein